MTAQHESRHQRAAAQPGNRGDEGFHPALQAWFKRTYDGATEVQKLAWPSIAGRQHTLLAAPTGSGKTLAAFLSAINDLLIEGLRQPLPDQCRVLYISPLKALSNDINRNLTQPLAGIRDALFEMQLPDVFIRTAVRTGDTTTAERTAMRRQPPHILVTTPESAFILLSSDSGRDMLKTVRTVIVDEIHALAASKRGAHFALTLERLQALAEQPLLRVGCSATQNPITAMADYLVGERAECATIVDTGHERERDLALELPGSPLEPVMAAEVWQEIYDRLAQLASEHRTTLVFVNNRRLAERAARHLAERLGEDAVTAHHGSLAREHRLQAEQRLKQGELTCLVATASLELGIDIGDVDLVCQLGSPHSIAVFLQRVGRSGHGVKGVPKGRLFPLSLDELVECCALMRAVQAGQLDKLQVTGPCLDALAQQIVAEIAAREWDVDDLYRHIRQAWPYRELGQDAFLQVVRMLADGFSTRRGRRGAYVHFDEVNGKLRCRRGARLTAVTNAGVIPDQFDYQVLLAPADIPIGTLNEDFAFESLPGDIFQLGNTPYRILRVQQGTVRVEDATGQSPTLPFWLGEAPGRSDELSRQVSDLRAGMDDALGQGEEHARQWLRQHYPLDEAAAEQLTRYLASARAALGLLPTQQHIVFERFFDETGAMHFVVHSPWGSRINRAWGLSLRKKFCRRFNVELQAAALSDAIVLSLSASHSFPITDPASYLKAATVEDTLQQAVLAAPIFPTHWRWVATAALAVKRFRNGKKTPPAFQRADAEDLIAAVFPDQLACAENLAAGAREIPDHPLVRQTLDDCLRQVMDVDGLKQVLQGIERNEIRISGRDLAAPSALSAEIISAKPYAFLDDAPAEERRVLAVANRRLSGAEDAAHLASLDADAIADVRQQAWPAPASADELHDALNVLGFMTVSETAAIVPFDDWWSELTGAGRATAVGAGDARLHVAAERLAEILQVLGQGSNLSPAIEAVRRSPAPADRDDAIRELIRSRLEGLGPVTSEQLAQPLGIPVADADFALASLEHEGFVFRGRFIPGLRQEQWCERHLLARIHRYTVKRLRSRVEPVSAADYMRFLLHWHGLDDKRSGDEALAAVLMQLEGFSAPAAAWCRDILPARVASFNVDMLDRLCLSGRFQWLRPRLTRAGGISDGPVAHSPIAFYPRRSVAMWLGEENLAPAAPLSEAAQQVHRVLESSGAAFSSDLCQHTGLSDTQLVAALAELVSAGCATADGFTGLNALLKTDTGKRRRGGSVLNGAGRWSLLSVQAHDEATDPLAHRAWALLQRYGVVVRKVLEREEQAPTWRELLSVFWRLEARGEIRGGRFVDGFAGEQFALPEAVGALRQQRKQARGQTVAIAPGDPLNLVGIILPGERIASTASDSILLRDGAMLTRETRRHAQWLQQALTV